MENSSNDSPNKKSNRIIYIVGIGHSGSTILDMALAVHPQIIGLGEIGPLLQMEGDALDRAFEKYYCSCGNRMKDCAFWSKTQDILKSNDNRKAKIEKVIQRFYQICGSDKIMLDSSKNTYKYLDTLHQNYDLRVIYLVRDFRSWLYSRFLRFRTSMLYFGYWWLFENMKLKYFIKKWKLNYMTIGYEELVFYPEYILNKISEFLEISYTGEMLNPDKTKSHIVKGNVLRGDPEKRKKFVYDARWMTSARLNFILPLLFPLYRWNKKHVYSNFITGTAIAYGKKTRDFYLFGNSKREALVNNLEK